MVIAPEFWAEHSVSELRSRSEYWLGMQGRLTEPVHKPAGEDHYKPVSWPEAIRIIADKLKSLDSPDEAAFYTSGRTSNEAAFLYQLMVRGYGTNNLPDCSNMCHESSGWAMGQTIGIGKATVNFDDYAHADLIIVMGQNPGTNHPRMLTELEACKENGGEIVAVNPLPEAGLRRYKNPQKVKGIVGHGTRDRRPVPAHPHRRRHGAAAGPLQAGVRRRGPQPGHRPGPRVPRRALRGPGRTPGTPQPAGRGRGAGQATGLRTEEIDELAARYLKAEKVIITWAMGITQQKKGVATIKEIINLLLLRGNIGKPGAGASPIRGHSNVQGDRTMGIWEQMPQSFMDALGEEFGFEPPREHGVDAVETINKMRDGGIRVFVALGGNFVGAISDTNAAEAAMQNTELSVQISTKLNRSHTVTGAEALILPTMGRSEIDIQESGPQFVSVEDTVCAVHPSWGSVEPVSHHLLSEPAIVSRLGKALVGDRVKADWDGFEKNYDLIRDHISRVVGGCENYNERIRQDGRLYPGERARGTPAPSPPPPARPC